MGGDSFSPVQDYSNTNNSNTGRPSSSSSRSFESSSSSSLLRNLSLVRLARHSLGILCLLVTILLFTASNFLASVSFQKWREFKRLIDHRGQTIFADNSYSKPYFVTYLNLSVFSTFLFIYGIKQLRDTLRSSRRVGLGGKKNSIHYSSLAQREDQAILEPEVNDTSQSSRSHSPHNDHIAGPPSIDDRERTLFEDLLNTRETAKLGCEFCLLLVGWHSVVRCRKSWRWFVS